jgi:hypothetical protein
MLVASYYRANGNGATSMGRPLRRDLTGLEIGFLVILGRMPPRPGYGQAEWLCKCGRCGVTCVKPGSTLNRGVTKSCGCLRNEMLLAGMQTTHGKTNTRVYGIWQAMKNRCYNKNQPHYERYGGRGIRVCREWRDSFEAFYAAMGDPPSLRHSIDRIDNNGSYKPGNCKWSTPAEQNDNQRRRKRRT